jgi:hypothetical protein
MQPRRSFDSVFRQPGLLLLAVLLTLCSLFIGVLLGTWGGVRLTWLQADESKLLQEQVLLLEKQLAAVQQLHTNAETRVEVDAAALELVRKELAQQQQAVAELEQGIRFYRSLMAPEELQGGLGIRGIDLSVGLLPGHYQFRLLVQQQARKHELISGTVRVRILGELDGGQREFELSELSEQVPRPDIKFKFKYFQAIDGELVLPDGFQPGRIVVDAHADRPRVMDASQEFSWPPRGSNNHVGQ